MPQKQSAGKRLFIAFLFMIGLIAFGAGDPGVIIFFIGGGILWGYTMMKRMGVSVGELTALRTMDTQERAEKILAFQKKFAELHTRSQQQSPVSTQSDPLANLPQLKPFLPPTVLYIAAGLEALAAFGIQIHLAAGSFNSAIALAGAILLLSVIAFKVQAEYTGEISQRVMITHFASVMLLECVSLVVLLDAIFALTAGTTFIPLFF